MKTQLLFVCLGNICRSPTAEAVMNKLLQTRGLSDQFHCDSAGTSGWHEGERADERMRQHGSRRGYNLTSLSRKFLAPQDYEQFDVILGMDASNIQNMQKLDPKKQYREKLFLMTDFCRESGVDEVPDPYYGGPEGFERVIDILEDACEGLLEHLLKRRL